MNTDIKTKNKSTKFFSKPKDFLMLFLATLSLIYLLNISFGIIEILPDNIPFIGNIDEALVTGILLSVLQYFNIDLIRIFTRN